MLIYPIASANYKNNKPTFQSKNIDMERFFNSNKIKEELSKIKTNTDAKKVFLSLSVLAASVLAELTSLAEKTPDIKNFADKILNNLSLKDSDKLHQEMTELFSSILNDKKEETKDYKPLIENNTKRAQYLSLLSDYPNLHEQYEQMLIKTINAPDDTKNKFTLETLEIAFDLMTKDNRLQYYESYFETLDNDYSDRLDDVASTIINAYKNHIEPLSYLQMLNSKRITPEEVTKWANAKNLGYDEFLKCKFLDGNILTNLSDLKANNNDFQILSFHSFNNYRIPLYTFKLHFKEPLPLEQKLKAITDVHTAIYGPIALNDESDIDRHYFNSDIRTELTDNILKDKMLESVYNFIRYINPDSLKDINLTSDDVKSLPTESETYQKIKEICSREIMNLNPEDPRLFELYEVLQDNNIFENLFTTNHSKIRFITRFVLKNNPNPQSLIYKCKHKASILKKEMNLNLKDCNIRCYASRKGFAPQFFNDHSRLGKNIKITLNSSGNIHTIYEDTAPGTKDKKNQENEQ